MLRFEALIPKLADPDSSCVNSSGTSIAKKVPWSNEIWAQRSSADVGQDESSSPQFGIIGFAESAALVLRFGREIAGVMPLGQLFFRPPAGAVDQHRPHTLQRSAAALLTRLNGLRDRWVNGLASTRLRPCNRYTLESAAAPASGANRRIRHHPPANIDSRSKG
jgi:hypothetical protein